MPDIKPLPVLSEAAERVLSEIIRITENNELDKSKSSAWIFSYPYAYDNQGNAWHKDINIKNDKSIRELFDYLIEEKLLHDVQFIEHNYVPDNIKLREPYKYIFAFEFSPADGQKLAGLKGSTKPTEPLSSKRITDKFSVHKNNLISYEGRWLELEAQVSKIAALIMERSVNGQHTSTETIIDTCLSEAYLEKASKSKDEELVFKYVRRCISDARSSFRAATKADKEKDFFPNKAGVGYIFQP